MAALGGLAELHYIILYRRHLQGGMLTPLFRVEGLYCTLMFITFASNLISGFFGRKEQKSLQ